MNKTELLNMVKVELTAATEGLVGGPEAEALDAKLSTLTKAELSALLNGVLKAPVISLADLNAALETSYEVPTTIEAEENPAEEVVEEAPTELVAEEPVVVEEANWFKKTIAFLFKKHLATTLVAIIATVVIVTLSVALAVATSKTTTAEVEPVVETTEYYTVTVDGDETVIEGLLYTVTGDKTDSIIVYVDGDYEVTYTTGDDNLQFDNIVVNVEKTFNVGASALTVIGNDLYIVNGTTVNVVPNIKNMVLTTEAAVTFGVNESVHTLYNVIANNAA